MTYQSDFGSCNVTDTLVLSRLADPQREGGHSLENWGQLLGCPKGEHNDWDNYSQEMVEYCKQDVLVNVKVYYALRSALSDFGSESISLEHQVQSIISTQIHNGWLLDQEGAFVLLAKLKERKFELEDAVHNTFKPLPTYVRSRRMLHCPL
jgi:DNA polymerase-1